MRDGPIARVCRSRGMKIKDAAVKAGFHPNVAYCWNRTGGPAKYLAAKRLADALGVPVEALGLKLCAVPVYAQQKDPPREPCAPRVLPIFKRGKRYRVEEIIPNDSRGDSMETRYMRYVGTQKGYCRVFYAFTGRGGYHETFTREQLWDYKISAV